MIRVMPEKEQPIISPEEEIKQLEKKLEEKKHELEESGKEYKPQEAAKEVIKEYSAGQATPAPAPPNTQAITNKLQNEPHARQVEELLNIAQKKGIVEAVNVARHLDNPHLLDDLHDRLALELSADKPR